MDGLKSRADWLPVHRDQLQAQLANEYDENFTFTLRFNRDMLHVRLSVRPSVTLVDCDQTKCGNGHMTGYRSVSWLPACLSLSRQYYTVLHGMKNIEVCTWVASNGRMLRYLSSAELRIFILLRTFLTTVFWMIAVSVINQDHIATRDPIRHYMGGDRAPFTVPRIC